MTAAQVEYRICRATSEAGITYEVNSAAEDGWRAVAMTTTTLRGEDVDVLVVLLERPVRSRRRLPEILADDAPGSV